VKPHVTDTPEYWESRARDERAFAREDRKRRTASVESVRIHEVNAADYQGRADALRAAAAAPAAPAAGPTYKVVVTVVEVDERGEPADIIGEWTIAEGISTPGAALTHGQKVRRAGERVRRAPEEQ